MKSLHSRETFLPLNSVSQRREEGFQSDFTESFKFLLSLCSPFALLQKDVGG